MARLLIATNNLGKVKEIKALMAGIYDDVISLQEYGLSLVTIEDAETFEGNARKKSMAAFEATGLDTLADDSGLSVDMLGGNPGVYSARYAGKDATDDDNNAKLIKEMKGVPIALRTARFVSTIVLVRKGKEEIVTKGECDGKIIFEPMGTGGFGYDPYFYVDIFKKTMAQLTPEQKNSISHRGKALQKLKQKLINEKASN